MVYRKVLVLITIEL